jgi:ubiquitin C-terminal hydrolase
MRAPFGLRNKNGSCWINAALQAVFRIPDLQKRFSDGDEDSHNTIEVCLSEIWGSNGEEGLKEFYECVKVSPHMPAGEDIGDSHELIAFLCDKIPFLDKLMRFKVANVIKCDNCAHTENKADTMNEFSIAPSTKKQTVSDAIAEAVRPLEIPDWKCEECGKRGCRKQLLLAEFPQILVFHQTSMNTSAAYTPVLVLNKLKYALFSVVCFTGGHWFTWGRDLPPGKPWYRLDDTHVQTFDPKSFPLADNMRLLMYYRINE